MTDMTEARVLELIAAYGPEPAAWPDAEREAAAALLRAVPEMFEEALIEARMLDDALAAFPVVQPPAGLAARIIASAPTASAKQESGFVARLKSLLSIDGQLWPSATALASAMFGLLIGYGTIGAAQVAEVDLAEEAVFAAFDETFDYDIGDIGL